MTVTSIAAGKFWAEVVAAGGEASTDMCTVRDEADMACQLPRGDLRARVWYTIAQTGVTNDKKHDSYSTQHFMDIFIDEWVAEAVVMSIHIHSDNAGSHFKNSRTLNYLSRLHERLDLKATWSFGCPGHGEHLGGLGVAVTLVWQARGLGMGSGGHEAHSEEGHDRQQHCHN